jgi:hypothetical protein
MRRKVCTDGRIAKEKPSFCLMSGTSLGPGQTDRQRDRQTDRQRRHTRLDGGQVPCCERLGRGRAGDGRHALKERKGETRWAGVGEDDSMYSANGDALKTVVPPDVS